MPDTLDNIEPVNPRFFGSVMRDTELSEPAKQRIVDAALNGRMDLEKARSSIVRARQEEKFANLRYESQEFALSEARRRAQEEQDNAALGASFASQFTSILDDPELDTEQKHLTLGRLRLNNADAFTRIPELRDQYAVTESLLPPRERPLTMHQQIALARDKRTAEMQGMAYERQQEEDTRRAAKENVEFIDSNFKMVDGAKLKGDPNTNTSLDEFADPSSKEAAVYILKTNGHLIGFNADPESLGAAELSKLATRARNAAYAAYRAVSGGGTPGVSTPVSKLGIPTS